MAQKRAHMTTASASFKGLRVVSLNISWEANAAKGGKPSPSHLNRKMWSDAKRAWQTNPSTTGFSIGPAYVQSLKAIRDTAPDVVLLQEYQMYRSSVQDALDILNNGPKFYVLAAECKEMHPTCNFGSIVIVNRDRLRVIFDISDDVRGELNRATGNAFGPGRALAASICNTDDGNVLIVSSHSGHGFGWNNSSFTRNAVAALANKCAQGMPDIIWGGDFNSVVKIGRGGAQYGRKSVYKAPSINPSTGAPLEKTHPLGCIDWIMCTSSNSSNPRLIGNDPAAPHRVKNAASDHKPVAVQTTSDHTIAFTQ